MLQQQVSEIIKGLSISHAEYDKELKVITRVGGLFSIYPRFDFTGKSEYVIPDIIISEDGQIQVNGMVIQLNKKIIEEMENAEEKKANKELQKDYTEAKYLKEMLVKRSSTLANIAELICIRQKEYLEGKDTSLKSLSQKELITQLKYNKQIELKKSTISRALKGKLIKLPFGEIVPLLQFFSKQAKTTGDDISNDQLEEMILEIVAVEDKNNPLCDEKITEILGQKGILYKQRAITNHRKKAGIQNSKKRKIAYRNK